MIAKILENFDFILVLIKNILKKQKKIKKSLNNILA